MLSLPAEIRVDFGTEKSGLGLRIRRLHLFLKTGELFFSPLTNGIDQRSIPKTDEIQERGFLSIFFPMNKRGILGESKTIPAANFKASKETRALSRSPFLRFPT